MLDHFLGQYASEISITQDFASRKGIEDRWSHEEAFDQSYIPEPYDTPDIWGFSPEDVDGDILDIVFSDSFQNLRGKSQQGIVSSFINRFGTSRFEHSVDALFLLRMLASRSSVDIEPALELRTISHDIGHGAGSHWSEMVMGDDYSIHDKRARKVLEAEGLWGRIEQRYGDIFEQKYPLLEASKPDLSIDRLAYILKDAWKLKGPEGFYPEDPIRQNGNKIEDVVDWKDVELILDDIEIHTELRNEGKQQELVFTGEEAAEELVYLYRDLEEKVYFNPEYDLVNQVFADAAVMALNDHDISVEELFALPDSHAMNLIAGNSRARNHMDEMFDRLKNGYEAVRTGDDPDIQVELRRDTINPKIRDRPDQRLEDMRRSSEISHVEGDIEEYRERDGEVIAYSFLNWDYPDVQLSNDIVETWEETDYVPGRPKYEKPGTLVGPHQRDGSYWFQKMKDLRKGIAEEHYKM